MIFDCIPFFNEFDLLEIRMAELDSIVDFHIICEADRTFTNKVKPLYFSESGIQNDKIICIQLTEYPPEVENDPWKMDRYQKQYAIDFLQKHIVLDNSTIILSDADEIPRGEALIPWLERDDWSLLAIKMIMTYYKMNCVRNKPWNFARIIRPGGPINLSKIRGKKGYEDTIHHGGWHFSYLGDIKEKLESFAHTEYNRPPYNTDEHIHDCVELGMDLFGRDYKFEYMKSLSWLPKYVLDNMEKFRKYIK